MPRRLVLTIHNDKDLLRHARVPVGTMFFVVLLGPVSFLVVTRLRRRDVTLGIQIKWQWTKPTNWAQVASTIAESGSLAALSLGDYESKSKLDESKYFMKLPESLKNYVLFIGSDTSTVALFWMLVVLFVAFTHYAKHIGRTSKRTAELRMPRPSEEI